MTTKKYLHRPKASHPIGDRAAKQIEDVCEEHGWAVQVVQRDYGEDLLIQPVGADDAVEHFRLWIQSKGTDNLSKHRLKNGNYSFSVSFAHAYKWLRSADLCIVVLWDTSKKEGVYAIPSSDIDEEWLYTKEPSVITLTFPKSNVFSKSELDKISWHCRLHHYETLISSAKVQTDEDDDRIVLLWSRVLDFLKALGIFEHQSDIGLRVNQQFLDRVKVGLFKLSQSEPDTDSSEHLRVAMMLTLIIHFEETTGLGGMPTFLAKSCEEFLTSALPALRKHGIV
ncbi:MAG: hypothetical protein FD135_1265 [Comamonadaceae bacterium]|nr:MAG: hypothetical protein FD135_1265 [Comamonadaceae bacterium]